MAAEGGGTPRKEFVRAAARARVPAAGRRREGKEADEQAAGVRSDRREFERGGASGERRG
eukprot:751249-Hanusia_phi.AAC.2